MKKMTETISSKTKNSVLLIGNFLSTSRYIPCVSEGLNKYLVNSGWSVFTTSNKPCRIPRLIDQLKTIWIKRRKYNIAHVEVYSKKAFLLAEIVCLALRLIRKSYILTLHGGGLPRFAHRWPRRVKNFFRSSIKVTAPSLYLLKTMSVYKDDIILIQNPLNLKDYKFTLRKKIMPRIIWLRGFHEIYNPCLVPKVIALLVDDFQDIEIKMIGPDKGDGSLQRTQQLANNLGVANRIEIQDGIPKNEVSSWMNKGDIFINTTNVDNTPISVLEAMACGLCVVSTNVGGIPYLLEHEYDALLVPPDNPEAMARAIQRLLTQSRFAKYLAKNAYEKVKQMDWSVVFPKWEMLLTDELEKIHK